MTRIVRTRPAHKNEVRRTRRKPLVLEPLEDRTVPSFLPAVNYSASAPTLVATGDFNADGNRDLATVNTAANLHVRMGAGDGTFLGLTTLTTGSRPAAIAVADLNSDGCDDLLNTHGLSTTFSVHLSNCDGTFAPRLTYTAGLRPIGITVADYNLDGYLDVATANYGGDNVSVMLGGASGFGAPVAYATGVGATLVIASDVNYDGAPDLVVSNGDGLSVLINNSDGTFAAAVNYATGSDYLGIVSVDLNGDSLLDLVAASSGSDRISILIGNGNGTFQAPTHINFGPKTYPSMIAVADYDLNGTPDLAVSTEGPDEVLVLLGNGDGTFQAPLNLSTPEDPLGLVTDDFNFDGYSDLLTANVFGGSTSVFINDGVWSPSPQRGGNGDVIRQLARPERSGAVFTPTPEAPYPMPAAVGTMLIEPIASAISADVVSAARRTATIHVVDEFFGLNLL